MIGRASLNKVDFKCFYCETLWSPLSLFSLTNSPQFTVVITQPAFDRLINACREGMRDFWEFVCIAHACKPCKQLQNEANMSRLCMFLQNDEQLHHLSVQMYREINPFNEQCSTIPFKRPL